MISFRDMLRTVRTLGNPLLLYACFVLFAAFWYYFLAQELTIFSAAIIVGLAVILVVTMRAIVLYILAIVNFSLSFNPEFQQSFFLPFETVHARVVKVLVQRSLRYDSLSSVLTYPEQALLKTFTSVRSRKADVFFTMDPFLVVRVAQGDNSRVILSMMAADDKNAKTMLKLLETELKR